MTIDRNALATAFRAYLDQVEETPEAVELAMDAYEVPEGLGAGVREILEQTECPKERSS